MILLSLKPYGGGVLCGLLVGALVLALRAPGALRADVGFNNPNHRIVTTNVTGAPTTYPVTVTAIIKIANLAGAQRALFQAGRETTAAPNGYVLYFVSPDQMNIWLPGPNSFAQALGTIPLNKWLYVAWSLGSTTSQRYYMWDYEARAAVINTTTTTTLGAIAAPVATVKLGIEETNVGTWTFDFQGTIRQVAVYAKDWTASPDPFRAMAYLGPYAVATPTLLYSPQEGSGGTTVERRGNGNNGTLNNSVVMPWTPMNFPRVFPVQ
jgi:hypothetical protein